MTALSFSDACERVKGALDIVDIVQRHVILKKTGRNYSGKCPFHNDKSPSMNVSREKGIFKCFACGVGGDALTFLMKIENRSFGELIRELAQEQGIEILRDGRDFPDNQHAAQKKDVRDRILALNEAALGWFRDQLSSLHSNEATEKASWQAAKQAVQNRYHDATIRQSVLERFDLGLALPGWENLSSFLKSKFDFLQANPNLLVDAGLASARDNGQGHYDRFRNRLIIPIRDDQNRVVAFGARSLSDEDKPKYLNSPETPLYHKNQVLYGLSQAKETIRQSRTAIVMEGYFDVISAHVAGVTEAVGSCGTALTEQHLKLLTRFGAERVILAFDSDEAGLKAALSAIELMAPYLDSAERGLSNFQSNSTELLVQVLTVPDGKDPDDYIRQNGGDAFRGLMASAKPYLTFQCDMAIRGLPLELSEGRIQAAARLTPILVAMNRPTVREEYLHRYSERIGVSQEALALEVKRYEQTHQLRPVSSQPYPAYGKTSQKSFEKRAISGKDSTSFKRQTPTFSESFTQLQSNLPSRQQAAEKNLLRLMLYNPESFSLIKSLLNADTKALITDLHHQEILAGLLDESVVLTVAESTAQNDPQPGTFWEKLNHLYRDKADVLNCLAELALTADEFAESLGLNHLTGAALHSRLTVLTEQQLTLLADCRRRQQLLAMKTNAAANEGEAIALTYEFRDHLTTMAQPISGTG